ncbi:MAG: hypothetical protein QOH36_547 [Actinomycetota bacterium]|nr:hypothetical protein [Actinomycetota bacterium]
MHPYVIEQMVEERQRELRLLAHADAGARALRSQARDSAWRRAVGRALVAGAVAVKVPRPQRRAAHCQVTATLGLESRC